MLSEAKRSISTFRKVEILRCAQNDNAGAMPGGPGVESCYQTIACLADGHAGPLLHDITFPCSSVLSSPLVESSSTSSLPQGSLTTTHLPILMSKGPATIDPPALTNRWAAS